MRLVPRDLAVADIGCGTGLLTLTLARVARRVVAVDASARMVRLTREKVDRASLPNVEVKQRESGVAAPSVLERRRRVLVSPPPPPRAAGRGARRDGPHSEARRTSRRRRARAPRRARRPGGDRLRPPGPPARSGAGRTLPRRLRDAPLRGARGALSRPATPGSPGHAFPAYIADAVRGSGDARLAERRKRRTDEHDHAARTRRQGPRPRRKGKATHGVGRPLDAGPRPDPRALREGEAPEGDPAVGLPPRHDRDGEPRPDASGRRRGGCPLRLEPPLDAGRRGGVSRRRLRRFGLRDQGREPQDLLRPHPRRARRPPEHHDGRRGRPRVVAPLHRARQGREARAVARGLGEVAPGRRAEGARRGRARRHGGDDDRRDPPEGDGEGRASCGSRSSP